MPSPFAARLAGRLRVTGKDYARPTNDLFVRSSDQRPGFRHPDRRLLRGGDGRRVAVVRHPRHRQHRAPGLHHPRLLHRLYRQRQPRPRPDRHQHPGGAGVLRARRRHLSGLLRLVREARPGIAARPRLLLRPAVHYRSDAGALFRRRLSLRRGALYRSDLAHRRRRHPACAFWCRAWFRWR